MDDIDMLLSIVENPTRRRILESLVREPSYPLRLSKELGVSQQAVMKNLALMEQGGLVESNRVDSDMGPMRNLYTPSSEFTLVVEMHSSQFSVRVLGPTGVPVYVDEMTNEDAQRRVSEIDGRIKEIDEERAALVHEKEGIQKMFVGKGPDGEEKVIEQKIEKEV